MNILYKTMFYFCIEILKNNLYYFTLKTWERNEKTGFIEIDVIRKKTLWTLLDTWLEFQCICSSITVVLSHGQIVTNLWIKCRIYVLMTENSYRLVIYREWKMTFFMHFWNIKVNIVSSMQENCLKLH